MDQNKIAIYQTQDGKTSIDVKLEQDTVWLTQAQMAELFQKDQSVIARHIANVFKEGELDKNSNMQILHNTLSKYKPTAIYNLDDHEDGEKRINDSTLVAITIMIAESRTEEKEIMTRLIMNFLV